MDIFVFESKINGVAKVLLAAKRVTTNRKFLNIIMFRSIFDLFGMLADLIIMGKDARHMALREKPEKFYLKNLETHVLGN